MYVPGAHAGQKRMSYPLELELQMVLNTKLRSSLRATSALKCRAISQAPYHHHLKVVCNEVPVNDIISRLLFWRLYVNTDGILLVYNI